MPTERNRAHRAFAEGGFFYRKAEMQKRISDSQYKLLAGRNLHTAIDIVQGITSLESQLKEVTYARQFVEHMQKDPVYKQVQKSGVHNPMLMASSSDDTPGSESDGALARKFEKLQTHSEGAEMLCDSLSGSA